MKRISYFCNEVKRMTMKRSILIIMLCIIATAGNAQLPLELSRMNRQKAFKKAVPAGNYSGITRIAGNHYALVSDKADQMGFYLFTIDIDSISGKLRRVACEDFISTGMKSDDEEAIAYVPQSQTLWLTSEATTTVRECDRQGRLTGRQLPTQQHQPTVLDLSGRGSRQHPFLLGRPHPTGMLRLLPRRAYCQAQAAALCPRCERTAGIS